MYNTHQYIYIIYFNNMGRYKYIIKTNKQEKILRYKRYNNVIVRQNIQNFNTNKRKSNKEKQRQWSFTFRGKVLQKVSYN